MQVTGWSRGLEVSGGGTGVVSHAGLALLRRLADKTGLTGGLSADTGGHVLVEGCVLPVLGPLSRRWSHRSNSMTAAFSARRLGC